MGEPTARDRAQAFECWADSDPVEAIAAALAAERERVLALFLSLTYASDDGSEYEHDHGIGDGYAECPACWVEDIRNTATETTR